MSSLIVDTDLLSADVKIDALAYIDEEYNDPTTAARVKKLIEEEMRSFVPGNYLAALPKPEFKFENSCFMKAEMERVAAGKPMEAMDHSRYRLDPPTEENINDPSAWETVLKNAQAQLEHQQNRVVNLELLKQFGANSWKEHNEALESMQNRILKHLEEEKKAAEDVNVARKSEQMSKGVKITGLCRKWDEVSKKNYDIELACAHLDQALKKMKAEAQEKSIALPEEVLELERQAALLQKEREAANQAGEEGDVDMED